MAKTTFALALLFLIAKDARSSCCSQAASGGAGRLLAHERALIEVSSKASFVAGSFNDQSRFTSGHKSVPYAAFEQNLHIMGRVVDYFMPFIHLPVVFKKGEDGVGGGFADITLGARSLVLKADYFAKWPSISLVNAVKIPSGAKSTKDYPLSNVEITSSGTWQVASSLLLEKDFSSITYGLSYGVLIEKARLGHAISVSSSFLVHKDGSLNLAISPIFYGPISLDGQKLPKSDQRKLSVGASYSLKLHSQLALTFNAGSDIPLSLVGKNTNCEFFARVATRFGVF